MDFNAYSDKRLAIASYIGLELDFFCKFSIKKVAEKFSSVLKTPVIVITTDEFTPENGKFYIKESYSLGSERFSFISAPMPYSESRQTVIKAFSLIKEYCYTDETCIAKVDYSYNEALIPISIKKLDILKFILEFNEDMMWKFFPSQKDSLYVKSIKNILPQNKFYRSENVNVQDFNYILPNMEFFGVLFNRVKDGFVEFRYIGGKDYEYKIVEALDLIGIYNGFLSKCLFMPNYTDKNKADLKKIIKSSDRRLKSYDSYEHFAEAYPKIKLTVDLDTNPQIIKSKYAKFRDQIFDLLASSDITEGSINYDSAMSRIQIENVIANIYTIHEWEFINCDLVIQYAEKCSFFECRINNSSLSECNLYRFCKVKNSRLRDTYINRTSEIENTYITGKLSTIEGIIKGGKIASGRLGIHSQVSKQTELIDYTKIYNK